MAHTRPHERTASAPRDLLCLADGGLGMASNTIAHAMAYFRGCLYVGTTNSGKWGPGDTPRILRFDFDTGRWRVVYTPPLLPADPRAFARDVQLPWGAGRTTGAGRRRHIPERIPREFGYRAMTVFQGAADAEPALYVATMSLWGALILRSADGERFEPVCAPGLGNNTILSFRGLVGYRGRLFVAPAGTITEEILDRNFAPEASLFCADDPLSGRWQRAAEVGFGDPGNSAIYSLAVAHGHLYAGTNNRFRGFQLWRTAADGSPPFRWTPVLADGAYRYNLNMATAAMADFNGALYVGGGIPGFGYDRANDVGPAAAELIRVHPDHTFDLIFGEPRFTPAGLKVPLSGMGPGLDDPYNSVVWSMAVHGERLFLGTHQWQPFDEVKTAGSGPLRGGSQLWASDDGERWEKLLDRGLGNAAATGIRSLASTPLGLVIGTANHCELLRLLARLHGRTLAADARPGFEVWLR